MKFQLRNLVVSLAVAMAATTASHADSFFLKLVGQKTGAIKGGVTMKGREGSIQVLDMVHSVVSPRDPQSGLPTGQRMHKPFTVTIPLDQSAPLLWNMLSTNENVSAFQLNFWTPQLKAATGAGAEVQQYTIRLTNANIASIEQTIQFDAAGLNPRPVLKVSFTYQKIEWTWTAGGITAMDVWESRV